MKEDEKKEWIVKYLDNELSPEEKFSFEQTLQKDETLRQQLAAQQEAEEILKDVILHQSHQAQWQRIKEQNKDLWPGPKKNPGFFKPYVWGIAASVLIISLLIGIYWTNRKPNDGGITSPLTQKDSTEASKDTLEAPPTIDPEKPKTPEDESPTPKENPKEALPAPTLAIQKDSIPEQIFSNGLGFAGSSPTQVIYRPTVFYLKKPEEIEEAGRYYKLEKDTLRLYGLRPSQKSSLRLLHNRQEESWRLVIAPDTFTIRYRLKEWKKLP
ncbi:MAG: hypothetical protein HC913_13580 [Microscillaceae bacterium]|nr:hypothetical protein [Microscillaceae bacterium]